MQLQTLIARAPAQPGRHAPTGEGRAAVPLRSPRTRRPLSASAERARKKIVAIVFVIYLLAIFEGTLRKFVIPEYGQFVFFIRDPFLIAAYLLATWHGLWPRRSILFQISVAMAVGGLLLFGIQTAIGGQSETRLLLGIYGWRSYFLYVPLAFLVGEQFRRVDIQRLAYVTLVLSAPVAVMVSMQFSSPGDAAINVGTSEDERLQFKGMQLTTEHIRPTGPFTSNVGQQQFVTTAEAFLLASMLSPARLRKAGPLLLTVSTGAILTCVALSGSRGTFLQSIMIALFAPVLAAVGKGGPLRAKAFMLPVLLGVAAVVLYPVVFPEGLDAFAARWNHADATESQAFEGGVFGRALYSLIDFTNLFTLVPPLGYGLGYGGNASTILGATIDGVMPGRLAESDYARHMVDLGYVLAPCYILFRLAFVALLARTVWRVSRRVADPLPMMLFAYAGYVVAQSQITGNGAINAYGWLFAGLCIASVRNAWLDFDKPMRTLSREQNSRR